MNTSEEKKEAERSEKADLKPLPTIWRVPDELWEKIEPILWEKDPPKATGRKRESPRKVLDTLIFRLRSNCQWNHFPDDLADDSTTHRTFERWIEAGVFPAIWAVLVEECEELGGVDWEWQAADGALGKARQGGIKSVPTRLTEGRQARSGAY